MAFSWNVGDSLICRPLPAWVSQDDICFPGGFCLSHVLTTIQSVPSFSEMALQHLSQLGPAMSFMAPFFNVLDAALAIYRCVKAVPDAITSLDPTELLQCVPDLVEKINQLLNMIPYLSLPRMIKRIIRAMANLLRGIANDLDVIRDRLDEMLEAIDDAADLSDVTLSGFLACAQNTVEDGLLTTAEALKGIGRIILLVNILMGLFGGPEIPCFGTLLDDVDVLDPVIDALRELANLLDKIADSIIDPQLKITLALQAESC